MKCIYIKRYIFNRTLCSSA